MTKFPRVRRNRAKELQNALEAEIAALKLQIVELKIKLEALQRQQRIM